MIFPTKINPRRSFGVSSVHVCCYFKRKKKKEPLLTSPREVSLGRNDNWIEEPQENEPTHYSMRILGKLFRRFHKEMFAEFSDFTERIVRDEKNAKECREKRERERERFSQWNIVNRLENIVHENLSNGNQSLGVLQQIFTFDKFRRIDFVVRIGGIEELFNRRQKRSFEIVLAHSSSIRTQHLWGKVVAPKQSCWIL